MTHLKIKLPFFVEFIDYHQIDGFLHTINCLANTKIKAVELDTDRIAEIIGDGSWDDFGYYIAIFYEGKKPSMKKIIELIHAQKITPLHGR